MREERERVQRTEHLEHEVVLLLALVQVEQALRLEEGAQRGGGLRQVVVGDGGEEQVVHQVAFRDVVVVRIDTVTVCRDGRTTRL